MSNSTVSAKPHAAPTGQEHSPRLPTAPLSPAPINARSMLLRYGVALVSAVLAVLLRELLTPLWGNELPFLTLYPVVLVSAWYGGLGPGLVTTALCATAANYFWMAPFRSLGIYSLADQVGLALAVLVMLISAHLTAALRRTQEQLEHHVRQVQARTTELTRTNANLQNEIITRQRIEQHLHERVEELETLWDLLPISVWHAHDPAGTHITGNVASYEMIRMPVGLNSSLSALPTERSTTYTMHYADGTAIPPEALPMQYAAIHGVAVPTREYLYRFADGSPEVHAYGTAKPLFDAHGQVRGSLGVFIDITAQVQAERALRTAHEKLRAHIENTPLAVVECDSECRVQQWSPQAEQLFGWTIDEVHGQRLDEIGLLVDEDMAAIQAEIDQLINHGPLGGVPQQVKTNRNRTKNGRVIHCQWYNSILSNETGRLHSLLSLIHDVTASVEAQAVLRHRREELERVVQERTAELTQANEALRLSALVLEQMAEGVLVLDYDTHAIVFTNPAFDALSGYARGELVGQHVAVLNAYTPEENTRLFQEARDAVQATGIWTREVANRKKDGTLFTSSVHSVVLERAGKKYWVSVQQDITARKAMETALRESEERFQLFMDHSPTIAWMKDEQGRHVYLNKTYEQRFGVRLADWRGKTDADLWPPEVAEVFRQNDQAVLAAGHPHEVTEHTVNPDGTGCTWGSFKFPFQDATGKKYVAGIGVDITARLQAEEALRTLNTELEQRVQERTAALERLNADLQHEITARQDAEQQLRERVEELETLFDLLPVAVWIGHDPAGTHITGNRASYELLRMPPGNNISSSAPPVEQPTHFTIHSADGTALQHADLPIQYVGTHGVAITDAEYLYRFADGTETYTYGAAKPLFDARGQVRGSVAVLLDITARKQAEKAVAQQARDLARAHADLRQVAYVSAHDLQEPVRQLSLYTQRLALRYGNALEADVQEAVTYIVEGAKRMQMQFTDLTHYLEVDEHPHVVSQTNCDELLQQALAELREAITESAAVVTHDPLPTLTAHAKHLQLVFHELLDNALKFRNSVPPRVHVWAERMDNGWRFAVHDNGIGVASSATDQLFRFFRKFQRRTDYSGTGMGLAICKKIVERHGGRIWTDSKPGERSIFYFTINEKSSQERSP